MAAHKDHHNNQKYSVDDILEEYGSRQDERPKVVEFPEAEEGSPGRPSSEQPSNGRQKKGKTQEAERHKEMPEIRPAGLFYGLGARIHTIRRRADHYADHMYDHAELDEEARKAEKYLPGVDQEESAPQYRSRQKRRREQTNRPAPPDITPEELADRFAKRLAGSRAQITLAVIGALFCMVLSLDIPGLRSLDTMLENLSIPSGRLVLLLVLLCVEGVLCWEIVARGMVRLFCLRVCAETLPALAFFFTLADDICLLVTGSQERLPYCSVMAFGLAFYLLGDKLRCGGDRLSARAAAQVRKPFLVTLDENKWSGRPAYVKWSGTKTGAGSQIQTEDGVHQAYRIAAPLMIIACLICSVAAAAKWKSGSVFLWTASSTLTAASAWSVLLVYSLPYRRLAKRLFHVGAALAGWAGIVRCREGGILVTDHDLFPTGSVQVTGIRVFENFSEEKVLSYTASMLRILNCGLSKPFSDLLRTRNGGYRECSGVRNHEGGMTGIIRNQEVIVGTAAFMHLMDIGMPQGLNVKHAIFCAIDGELAGFFALSYTMSDAVNPCLSALIRNGASPILVTRDPNLIPALLEQKFKLPVEKMEFPPVKRRVELSGKNQTHDGTVVALLSREGMTPYCDAVVGGKRLRSAVRVGTVLTLISSILGILLTFYLTFMGAAASLSVANFLIYMAVWLLPAVLVGNWVCQY